MLIWPVVASKSAVEGLPGPQWRPIICPRKVSNCAPCTSEVLEPGQHQGLVELEFGAQPHLLEENRVTVRDLKACYADSLLWSSLSCPPSANTMLPTYLN